MKHNHRPSISKKTFCLIVLGYKNLISAPVICILCYFIFYFENIGLFQKNSVTSLLRISIEISGGRVKSHWISRRVCQNLRKKHGFPEWTMQKKSGNSKGEGGHSKIDWKSRDLITSQKFIYIHDVRVLIFLENPFLFDQRYQISF